MGLVDESIILRDGSLAARINELVAGIAGHPDRIIAEACDDPPDPNHLTIDFYARDREQLDDWIAEVRKRLAEELGITDAPTSAEVDDSWWQQSAE